MDPKSSMERLGNSPNKRALRLGRLCLVAQRLRAANPDDPFALQVAGRFSRMANLSDYALGRILGEEEKKLIGAGSSSLTFDRGDERVDKLQYPTAGLNSSALDESLDRQRDEYGLMKGYFGELFLRTEFEIGALTLHPEGNFSVVNLVQPKIDTSTSIFAAAGLEVVRGSVSDGKLIDGVKKLIESFHRATGKGIYLDIEGTGNGFICEDRVVISDIGQNMPKDPDLYEKSKRTRRWRIETLERAAECAVRGAYL